MNSTPFALGEIYAIFISHIANGIIKAAWLDVVQATAAANAEALEAAFYLSCAEFARGELSKAVFSHQRRIYQDFRLARMNRGIQRWREEAEGFEMPGKVCHFVFNGDNPDMRNVTRMVPEETTVDDCAFFVFHNGGSHVLLGCSAGRWKTDWAAQPLLAGPNGWDNRRRSPAGTQYVPQPNCGWE